jgi:K(+)-stimulated pyrophosphate-energized sodium pump
MNNLFYVVPAFGLLALLFAFWKTTWINRQDAGTDKMKEIFRLHPRRRHGVFASGIQNPHSFRGGGCGLLVVANLGKSSPENFKSPLMALSFVVGAFCSALSGYFGMRVATKANVRTTAAARESLNKALRVAFSGGTVMGMSVVGLGLLAWARCSSSTRARARRQGYCGSAEHDYGYFWVQPGRIFHRPVRPCGRRHLHQGG